MSLNNKGLLNIFLSGIFILNSFFLTGQEQVQVSGRVVDIESGESLIGVNVIVKGKPMGTVTDSRGFFYLKVKVELPLVLRYSMIGYRTQEFTVDENPKSGVRIKMEGETYLGEEIVIIAPVIEVEQKTMREEVSIEMIDALSIRESPAANYFEAISNLKGVDITIQSMQFITINARGFNSTNNIRFAQFVDGIDNMAPGMNLSVGNVAGLSELDVLSVEFLPGPSSVEYGANALNGILLMNSKDPFIHQGLSMYLKPGVSDVEAGSDYPFQFLGKPLIDAGVRYAKAVNDNFALKINVSMMKGEDWYANDTTNIRPGNIHWEFDPGYDALNKYGDEITQEMPIGEDKQNIIVTRTGYRDNILVDNNVKSLKFSGSLHYKLGEKTTAIIHGNYGNATTVYTGDNRISLSGFQIFQGKAEIKGSNFMIRGYGTKQQSGNTYDTRYLAYNLNRQYSSDKQWFFDYYNAYAGNRRRFGVLGGDYKLARAFADRHRLEPGTTTFAIEKERLINSTDFTDGARLINHSSLMHVEGKYDFNELIPWADFEIGSNFRFYDLVSEGSIFPDTANNDITFYEYGGYLKASRKFLDEDLSVTASVRYDKSENFDDHLSPRISALYTFREKHNFRASFLTGYRNPGAKEQFMNKDIGPARLLGGLSELVSPYNLPMNGIFREKVYAFNDAVNADLYSENNPYKNDQAIHKNMDILTEGIVEEEDIGNLQPEKVISYELGYKSKLIDKLFLDAVYYRSTYENFIGYAEIVKPRTSPDVDLFTAATQVNNSTQNDVFYIYSNSHEKITIQGISAGMKYLFPIGAVISANATLSNLQTEIDDPIVPGFNTPVFKSNISVSNRRLDQLENNPGFKNVGFNVVWRWQSKIDWESPFASGYLKPVSTFDIQVSIHFDRPQSTLKMGVSNFFDILYANSFGGTQVGSFYYVSFTINNLLNGFSKI